MKKITVLLLSLFFCYCSSLLAIDVTVYPKGVKAPESLFEVKRTVVGNFITETVLVKCDEFAQWFLENYGYKDGYKTAKVIHVYQGGQEVVSGGRYYSRLYVEAIKLSCN